MKRFLLTLLALASISAPSAQTAKTIFRDSIVLDTLGRPIEKIWIDEKGKIDLRVKFEYKDGKIFYRRYYTPKGKLVSTVIGETED